MKNLFLTKYLSISQLVNSSLKASLVSSQVIPVSTNCYQSSAKLLSFDNGLEVRSVFLDISKVFDKVWYKGLIFKLKQNDKSLVNFFK